ncbi:MAG: glycosyltransferase family 4 protein, partial [Clostridia bacterium]
VDTDKFLPVNTKKNDTDRVVITSIGNLIPLKGHEYTLQAIKRMVDEGYKNIRFRLAGRGELEEKLKKLSEKLDINEYVEFMGYISYSDIMVLLQKSDIFVLPSYYEALGCVYLEAMSCAVPAIGCKNNGIDEIIIDGVNGYLVDNKNVDQIAECLRELMNQEKRLAVGEKARESVIKKYQWKNSAENLAKIYHSLNL